MTRCKTVAQVRRDFPRDLPRQIKEAARMLPEAKKSLAFFLQRMEENARTAARTAAAVEGEVPPLEAYESFRRMFGRKKKRRKP